MIITAQAVEMNTTIGIVPGPPAPVFGRPETTAVLAVGLGTEVEVNG